MIKNLFALLVLTVSASVINAQPVVFDWSQGLAGKSGYDGAIGMARDASGNIYITGEFSGTRDFGSISLTATSFSEVFVAKYNSSGACQWAVKGGANFSAAYAGKIAVSGSTVYVTGNFTNVFGFGSMLVLSTGNKDVFIASLDASNGAPNWVDHVGGSYDDIGINITPCASGGFLLCGTFTSTATFGTYTVSSSSISDADMFLARFDAAGACTWVKRFGSTGTDQAMCAKEMTNGDILLTGSFEQTVAFGATSLTSGGYADYFLAKLNSAGTIIWAVKGGGANTDVGNAVSFDPAGNIYTTGFIADTSVFGSITVNNAQNINVIVAKHNSSGVCQWVKHGGAILDDIGWDIVADYSGSTYFTGYVNGNSNFHGTPLTGIAVIDAIVGKYDNAGTLRWIAKVGGTGVDYGKSVLLDNAGYCFIAGDYTTSMTVGSTTLNAGAGTVGVFITRVGGGTVGINETVEIPFTMFPNPVSEFINLNLSKITDELFTVELISIDGKVVMSKHVSQSEISGLYRLDVSSLASGNFTLMVSTSKGDFSKPLMIAR